MPPPFVVFGLPRSRTFWLSRFLSYGGWECGHDELRHMRAMADMQAWLSQPFTGTVETTAGPFWRLLERDCPDARVAVLRRPVDAVVASLVRLGFDADRVAGSIRRADAKLAQIEARWPRALPVRFDALATEDACAEVFEHCLGIPHNPAWWEMMAAMNLQTSMPALVRYAAAFAPQLAKLRAIAEHQSRALLASKRSSVADDVTIAEEPFDGYFIDGERLRRDQYVAVGEPPNYRHQVNYEQLRRFDGLGALQTMIARCNGAVAGYLLSILSPSLDDARVLSAYHTSFYAAPAFPGLGMRLAIAANDALWGKGVGEIVMRAGTRGDGPKLGLLWRLLGAEPCGSLYMLKAGI